MCAPTAQEYFSAVREDDTGIGTQDRLLRNCRLPVQVVPCEVNGYVISGQVFVRKKDEAGTSIDLECLLLNEGKTWQDRFGAQPGTLAVVAVTAGDARKHSDGVAWTPKPEEPHLAPAAAADANPYHGEIIGISRSAARKLSALMHIVHRAF